MAVSITIEISEFFNLQGRSFAYEPLGAIFLHLPLRYRVLTEFDVSLLHWHLSQMTAAVSLLFSRRSVESPDCLLADSSKQSSWIVGFERRTSTAIGSASA